MPLRAASASMRLRSAGVTCTEINSDCFSAGGFGGRPIRLPFFFLMHSIILSRCANVKAFLEISAMFLAGRSDRLPLLHR